MTERIQIVFPSSLGKDETLQKSLEDLENAGFQWDLHRPTLDTKLPFAAGSLQSRLEALNSALLSEHRFILCGRGGYGASDLLPFLDWPRLRSTSHKWVIGFSDISALQSALYTKLGWPSIHGPMPSSELWAKNGRDDIEQLYELLRHPEHMQSEISVMAYSSTQSVQGTLFGGCLSVLCNLIGTPYFPTSLKDKLFFCEDTGESPGRLLRMVNQLLMSGHLAGCAGFVLGNTSPDPLDERLPRELAKRLPIPVFTTQSFGHLSPNFPIVIGALAYIRNENLRWSYGV